MAPRYVCNVTLPCYISSCLAFIHQVLIDCAAESKEVYHDRDFWADHDVDCHGPYESFEDDPDMAQGFIWPCCNKFGDDEGCQRTMRRAAVNVPTSPMSNKRKAEEDMSRPAAKRASRG